MTTFRLFILLPLLCALWMSACSKPRTDLLQVKLTPGQELALTIEVDQTMDMAIAGQNIQQDTIMSMEMTMAVEHADEADLYEMGVRYDRMAMSVHNQQMEMSYDTAKPEEGNAMLGMGIQPLIGITVTMIVDESARIKEVRGLDELIQKNPASGKVLEQMMSRESLSQLTGGQYADFLPDTPVKQGDSWEVDLQTTLLQFGSMSLKGTLTHQGYQEVDGVTCIAIGQDMIVDMELSSGELDNPQLKAMGVKISGGSLKGTMVWDPELGQARSSELVQHLTLSMISPMTGESMEMPMIQKIRTNVRPK